MSFPSTYQEILDRIDAFDPIDYGRSRNYLDGGVSYLSPYISRGVISTRFVLERLLDKGHDLNLIKKFAQELAWRDFWQNTWNNHGKRIDSDLRNSQRNVQHHQMISAIHNAQTGIEAIDQGIEELIETGYMHNHLRMYVAALATNIGQSHWKIPAQWMYYHLLDGDWASNNLSWQWVAGSNSSKKYIANQENINKYCKTNQRNTYLDCSYEVLAKIEVPEELKATEELQLKTSLPQTENPTLHPEQAVLVYNYYNLDPQWMKETEANRILLLEPSVFETYPVSEKALSFALKLSKNIQNIQVFVGEFSDLEALSKNQEIHFKEHPLNSKYKGVRHDRDWIFQSDIYYSSFFKFWKMAKLDIKRWQMV